MKVQREWRQGACATVKVSGRKISMPFKNRADAGRKLANALVEYKVQQPVILALPRGGVPVAAEVATALGAPLDLILVRKIGVPDQPELAMGAVVDGGAPIIVRNDDVIALTGVDEAEFKAICDAELAEIAIQRHEFHGEWNYTLSPRPP